MSFTETKVLELFITIPKKKIKYNLSYDKIAQFELYRYLFNKCEGFVNQYLMKDGEDNQSENGKDNNDDPN